MSESGTEVKVPLSVNNPEPQQPRAEALTEQERFTDIKNRWIKSDKSDLKTRQTIIGELKKITPEKEPPYGATSFDPKLYSEKK